MGKKRDLSWNEYTSSLYLLLSELSVKDRLGNEIGQEKGFQLWQQKADSLRESSGSLFLVGNGASASMASHLAADVSKNGGIRAHAFTNNSLLTAVGNDISYREIYAEPLRWYAQPNDMLVAISSSGNSPNIVRALEAADAKGLTTITLSAMGSDNRIRKMGELNFYIPARTYGLAESGHATILHLWMDLLENDS